MKKYQIIYADPPWEYKTYSFRGQTKANGSMLPHYSTMTPEQIKKLPIKEITDDKAILFLWATMPTLQQAFAVIKSWGFIYKTVAFTWVKQNPSGIGIYSGMGHWTNGNAELCLLATKKEFPSRIRKDIKQIQLFPRGKHSAKPTEIRNQITELMGDLPRIELFAREKTEGWDVWGNEVKSDIELAEKST